MSDGDDSSGGWTLLTGHGHVRVKISRNPDARIRDISAAAGYTVNRESLFRHPSQEGLRIGPFLALLAEADENPAPRRRPV